MSSLGNAGWAKRIRCPNGSVVLFRYIALLLRIDNRHLSIIRVAIAHSVEARRRGLLGRDVAPPFREGLLILRCPAIHMAGMRFPIDVIFLSGPPGEPVCAPLTIRSIHHDVRPGLRARACGWLGYFVAMPGVHALEVTAGMAERLGLAIGDRMRIIQDDACAEPGYGHGVLHHESMARPMIQIDAADPASLHGPGS